MSFRDSMFLLAESRERPTHVGSLMLFDRPEDGDNSQLSFRRVYQSATRLVAELCLRGPTVLAIDDVHVADADTMNLLALLARRRRR